VVMAWHPPHPPPPFLKRILVLFVLMPYMLWHYHWEDTIDIFKVRLAQYR
jgi:hypothetical protein